MYKIILVCCLILALAEGHISELEARTNDYIGTSRKHYQKVLQSYDTILHSIREDYSEEVQTINAHLSNISPCSNQVKEFVSHPETLSDLSKHCFFPTVLKSKTDVTRCIIDSSNLADSLLNGALSTRNALLNYFLQSFENEITNCKKKCENNLAKYSLCVISVISNVNNYTGKSQQIFRSQTYAAIQSQKKIIRELWIAVTLFKLGQCNSIQKEKCQRCDKDQACQCGSQH